jgi:hypothetical protein
VGAVRFLCAGVVAGLVTVAACADDSQDGANRFCHVARSQRMRPLEHLNLNDAEAVADATSLLSVLRAAAPMSIRHDLARILDDPVPATAGAAMEGDSGDVQAAARRVDRYLHDTCGLDL